MRISDWSSDVCSSDLSSRSQPGSASKLRGSKRADLVAKGWPRFAAAGAAAVSGAGGTCAMPPAGSRHSNRAMPKHGDARFMARPPLIPAASLGEPGARRHTAEDILVSPQDGRGNDGRSEEHTSELQSLMRT